MPVKPSSLRFADMNREELRAIAPHTLAILPIGATEQHGPHLPSGTDYFTVEHLAVEAARAASDSIAAVVTPALPFGSSDHHFIFGATLSLTTETYYRVLRELVLSLVKDGFRSVFIVNGHGGNHELAQLAARDVALNEPVKVAAGSYWSIAWDALVAAGAHLDARLPGHAGIFETSMMLALRPDLVPSERPSREGDFQSDPRAFQRAYRAEHHGSWQQINGFTDSPDRATAARGERDRDIIVKALAEAFVTFARSTS